MSTSRTMCGLVLGTYIYDRGDQPLDKEIGTVFAGQRGALQCALNNIRVLL